MIYLASKSPRRRELLALLGVEFSVLDIDIPEVRADGESPEGYVTRVAREKAVAGFARVAGVPGAIVIGSDTEVVLDDEVFGKPRDTAHAARMLKRLAGRTHRVLSALSCIDASREAHALSESLVELSPLDDAAIAAYVASGEPFGKAGGYAIQGRAAAFVRHLAGSHSGVTGLPLHSIAELLRGFGVPGMPGDGR